MAAIDRQSSKALVTVLNRSESVTSVGFLGEVLSDQVPAYETSKQATCYRITKLCLVVLGVAGRWIYVYPAGQLADRAWAKLCWQGATLAAWGGLSAWGLVRTFGSQFRAISPREQQLHQDEPIKRINGRVLKLALISIFSQIPTAYLGYYYTQSYEWPVVMLIADSGLPMLSMHKFLEGLRLTKKFVGYDVDNRLFRTLGLTASTEQEEKEFASRAKVTKVFSKAMSHFFSMQRVELRDEVERFSHHGSIESQEYVARAHALANQVGAEASKPSNFRETVTKVVAFVALAIPVFRFIVQSYYAWSAGHVIYDNVWFKVVMVAFAVLPTVPLTISQTHGGLVGAFNRFANALTCQGKSETPLDQVAPGVIATFRFLALVVGAAGMGSLVKVTDDIFDYQTVIGKAIMLTIVPTMFTLTCLAMLDLARSFCEFVMIQCGNQQTREAILLGKRFQKAIEVINSFTPTHIAEVDAHLAQLDARNKGD